MSYIMQRALSVSEVISQSIKLYCANSKKAMGYAFIISLMSVIVLLAFNLFASTTLEAIILGVFSVLILIATLIVGIGYYVALVSMLNHGLHQEPSANSQIGFLLGVKRFWPVLAGFIIAFLLVMIGLCLFILPGIFLLVALYIYWPLIVIEKQNPLSAFVNSIALTWGSWWRTLLVLIFINICVFIVYMILNFILLFLPHWIFHSQALLGNMILRDIVRIIIGTLFYPWFVAAAVVLLHDFKVRKQQRDS